MAVGVSRLFLGWAGVVVGVAAALALFVSPALAVSPEYSLEGTCAVVKLHPEDASAIATATAALILAADESTPAPVSVQGVGSLDGFDLTYGAVITLVAIGVLVGLWARGHSW